MKNEIGAVAIEEFVGLKLKMYLFLVDNSGHKKAKYMKISHNEYKDVLFHNRCLGHWMNRIQSKDHRIGT